MPTSIPISGLTNFQSVETEDFVALVESSSMTTYRVPVQSLMDLFADSGSVPSASWASESINSDTSSLSYTWNRTHTVVKNLSLTQENSINFFRVSGPGDWGYTQAYLVNLKVAGYHCSTSKLYLITDNYLSRGESPDRPWAGWYTAKPLSSNHRYPFDYNAYTDFDLELSHSNITQLHFRVRSSYFGVVDSQPTGSITILSLAEQTTSPDSVTLVSGEEVSSNNLPAWDSAFVEIKDYKMTVSGSLIATEGFSGSLHGTSSWAASASWAPSLAQSNSSSWASSSLTSVSASWASASISSSYATNTTSASFASVASSSVTSQTASYINISSSPSIAKAFGLFTHWADPSDPTPPGGWNATVVSQYNIASIVYDGTVLINPDAPLPGYWFYPNLGEQYKVTFTTPMPTANYIVVCGGGGEENDGHWLMWTSYPYAQTANYFYISRVGGNTFNMFSGIYHHWCQFVVYHP